MAVSSRQLTYMLVKVPNLLNAEFKHVKVVAIDAVTVHVSTVSQPTLQPVGYTLTFPGYQILELSHSNLPRASRSCHNKEIRDQRDRNSIQSNTISQHPSRTAPPKNPPSQNLSPPKPKASTQTPKRKGLPRHQMPSEYRPTLSSSKRLHRDKNTMPSLMQLISWCI